MNKFAVLKIVDLVALVAVWLGLLVTWDLPDFFEVSVTLGRLGYLVFFAIPISLACLLLYTTIGLPLPLRREVLVAGIPAVIPMWKTIELNIPVITPDWKGAMPGYATAWFQVLEPNQYPRGLAGLPWAAAFGLFAMYLWLIAWIITLAWARSRNDSSIHV